MIRLFFITLLLVSNTVSADIYKHIDPDGSVRYSSRPSKSAERMELRGVDQAQEQEQESAEGSIDAPIIGYDELIIDLPAANAVVRNDQASVRVSLTLNPALMSGHKVQVRIDGQSLPEALVATHFTLQNVQPGAHSLQASVVDEAGSELISAGPVQFSSQRFSAAPAEDPAQ